MLQVDARGKIAAMTVSQASAPRRVDQSTIRTSERSQSRGVTFHVESMWQQLGRQLRRQGAPACSGLRGGKCGHCATNFQLAPNSQQSVTRIVSSMVHDHQRTHDNVLCPSHTAAQGHRCLTSAISGTHTHEHPLPVIYFPHFHQAYTAACSGKGPPRTRTAHATT